MSIKTERLLSKAKKLLKKGQIEEAHKIFTLILKNNPSNLEAKNGLLNLRDKNSSQPKQNDLEKIVNLYNTSQFNKAIEMIDQLILKFNDNPFLYNIKGACLSEIADLDNAISFLEQAIKIKPDYAEAHFNLGVSNQKIGRHQEAIKNYGNALSNNHAYSSAHHNLGLIHLNQDRLEAAIKSFEWAIAYSPNYAEAHNSLGAAFQEIKRFDDAEGAYEKAVSLNGNYVQAIYNLGIVSEILNKPDEALKSYLETTAINPLHCQAHRSISVLKNYKADDPHIIELTSLYSRENQSTSDKIMLSFALAKVNEDLGNDSEYFKYLNEGNSLRKKELNYTFTESKNFHSTIVKVFESTQEAVTRKKSNSDNFIRPIFILGMPRSGTSLVEQIISSHHEVHGAGELLALRKIVTPILDSHLKNNEYTLLENDFLLIREQYLDFLSLLNTSERIITDKMPMNFRLIGFILSAMPEAKIIHIKRNAIATCWSNYKNFFSAGNGFSFNQSDLVNFYKLYTELMEFWHSKFPNKIYNLNYENLTTNQESETRQLLDYCGLDWDENCLDFHKNKRGVATVSKSQVRKKIYQGSSDAWKKYESYIKPIVEGLKCF